MSMVYQQIDKLRIFYKWDQHHTALRLLVLFGSRATGNSSCDSDWDIAFLSDPQPNDNAAWFPGANLQLTISEQANIPYDHIDLINLSTCSEILAHFVAQDGQLIYERNPGEFEHFRQRFLKTPAELDQYRQSQRDKVLQALARWQS